MPIKVIAPILACWLLCVSGFGQGSQMLADAEKAWAAMDFDAGFALFEKAANAGNSAAALRMSQILLAGEGVPKDTVGAFEWAKKSADGGNLEGVLLTASKYEEGRGVTKSLPEAIRLYEVALARKSPVARMKLAEFLDEGVEGAEKNRERALSLFQAAAEAGDAKAIFMVGLYLQRGFVVEKDENAASQWFLRAGELGEGRAQTKLAIRFFRGTGVVGDPVEALMWAGLAISNPTADAETKTLAGEYQEAISETVTPRKIEQAGRKVERFKLKTFKDISLPALPYKGPALVYQTITDRDGNQLEAAAIEVGAAGVLLERKSDGKRFAVPWERLSEESRKRLER